MASEFTVINGITLAIAFLGAVLGIMNTWRNFDRDQVKLNVVPGQIISSDPIFDQQVKLSISITNLSTFPVTITEVGFLFWFRKERGLVLNPIILDGGPFPRRLEPRTSFSAYVHSKIFYDFGDSSIRCVYAKTDCGETIEGYSPALKQLTKRS